MRRRLINIFFLIPIVICSFACGKSTKPVVKKEPLQNAITKEKIKNEDNQTMEINKLIEKLNYWAAAGGDPNHPIDKLTSTGESTSAFEKVMNELKKKNIKVKWVDGKYILDSTIKKQDN